MRWDYWDRGSFEWLNLDNGIGVPHKYPQIMFVGYWRHVNKPTQQIRPCGNHLGAEVKKTANVINPMP